MLQCMYNNPKVKMMAYKALYRTYRPSTFEEVSGQSHIVKTLQNSLKTNKIAHAYLFCGPRGTGKTSMAKLFAKALNCEKGIGFQCNECSNCIAINEGNHPDVIEIDAASNNGIDEVRELIEKVKYSPIKGKYKVYIIDEVHMMTSGAFNALLKTLEEPPAHVVFILATTEPHKVLPTILSRCQRYDFSKVSDDDIENRLVTILKKEDISYELGAVRLIIDLADGGVRDALSILDQVIAYCGNNIAEKDVLDIFGLASTKEKINLLELITENKLAAVLTKLEEFENSGINIVRLTQSLLDILKDTIVYQKTQSPQLMNILKEDEAKRTGEFLNVKMCNEMIDILLKAQNDFKTVSNIRSLFEIILLKMCSINDTEVLPLLKKAPSPLEETKVIKQSEIINEKKPIEVSKNEDIKKSKEIPVSSQAPDWLVEDIAKKEIVSSPANTPNKPSFDVDKIVLPKLEVTGESYHIDDEMMIDLMILGSKDTRKKISEKWNELSYIVANPNVGNFAAALADGSPYLLSNNILVIEFNFEKVAKKVNVKSNQKGFSDLLEKVLGKKYFIYAISRNESINLTKTFYNLMQANKLPKKDSVKVDINKIIGG